MTKHTPGPWHANVPAEEKHANGSTVREPEHGDVVAVVYCHRKEGTAIGNARLIAAAPDLLKVARAIFDRGYEDGDIYKQLQDAIRKAEGGA